MDALLSEYLEQNRHASAITGAELDRLEGDGYVVLRRTPEFWRILGIDLDRAARQVDELLAEEGGTAGTEGKDYLIRAGKVAEAGANRLANLIDKGAVFRKLSMVPDFLICAETVLGSEFRLSSFTMREPKPGAGGQGLHLDWPQRASADSPFSSICAYVCLDDMTPHNGPLRVLARSHIECLDITNVSLRNPDPRIVAAETQCDVVEAGRGDVIVLNVQTFHGGTVNKLGARRRVLFINYRNSKLRQQLNQNRALSTDVKRSLTPLEKHLLSIGRQSVRDWARDFAFRNRDRWVVQKTLSIRSKLLH